MKPQTIEVETPRGRVLLNITVLSIDGDVQDQTPQPASDDSGYKKAVAECHKLLDELGISSEKETCVDPECQSSLGHRLRKLREKYKKQEKLLELITQNPNKVSELLTGQRSVH